MRGVSGASLSLALLLAGCSMIATEYLGDTREPVREGTVAYSLPMTILKLAIFRREIIAEDRNGKPAARKAYDYDIAEFGEKETCRDRICSEILTVPDPQHNYIVRFRGSIFSDDTLTLQVSDKGYLTSADGTAVDRTGDIIVAATRLALGDVPAPKAHARLGGPPELVETVLVNPHDPAHIDMLNGKLRKYRLEVRCGGACAPPAPPVREPANEVYFRLKRTVFLEVKDLASGATKSAHPVMSFNGSPLVAQKIERGPFITRETQLAWKEGMPEKAHHKKPSEALGLVTVAGNVAGAVVYAPINALTQQTTQANKQKQYLEAREALLEQRLKMQQKEADVRVVTPPPAPPVPTLDGGQPEPPGTGAF